MKKSELLIILIGAFCMTSVVFRDYIFEHKTLFPSNLLMSSYSPWKYEPVPEYPNGPPNKAMGFDNIRQAYPDRSFLRYALTKGIVPLWNPYIYSGAPFMAASNTAVWYPLSWAAAILSTNEGWNFLIIVQPILSIVFMYIFLRSLRVRMSLAAYGAFVYAVSGWMIVYWQEFLVLEHSVLWLPLALYASNRLWERQNDVLGFFFLLFALTCSIFGGFLQMSIYVYCVVVLWNTYLAVVYKRVNTYVLTAIVLSILIACIQLIPSVEAFLLSPRGLADGSFVFKDYLVSFQHLITFLAPDYWGNPATYNYFGGSAFYFEKIIFIGIIPLLFAIYGMTKIKQKTPAFWAILGLISLSLGFALPTSWLPYYLNIPVLSSSYPTRIFIVSAFSLSVVSCYGLQAFLEKPDRKKMIYILAIFSAALAAGWTVAAVARCAQSNVLRCIGFVKILGISRDVDSYGVVAFRNMIIPTIFLLTGWGIVLISKWSTKLIFLLVCLSTAASGFYFAQKYVYFGENRFVYPKLPVTEKITELAGYDRVWGYGNAFIEKNLPEYFQWFSTDGYSNLSSGRYAELLSTIKNNGKIADTIRRSDTDLFEASERDPFGYSNPYRLRIMSFLGVKYILETKKGLLKDAQPLDVRFPPEIFSLVWEDDTWRIWQYRRALPRAMFVKSYIVRNNPQQIIDALYDPEFSLDTTVVLEKEPIFWPPAVYSGEGESSAAITGYGLNTVTVVTQSPVPGFVVLSDNYYPGWKVEVDGKPGELYRANYTLRAVAVPQGRHVVTFRYMPLTFIAGMTVSSVGVLFTAATIIYMYRNSRRQKNKSSNT